MVQTNTRPIIVTDASPGCEPDILSDPHVPASLLQWVINGSLGEQRNDPRARRKTELSGRRITLLVFLMLVVLAND